MGAIVLSTLERYPDWRKRLEQYVQSLRGQPFEYGSLDCCQIAGGSIRAMTGVDLMSEFRYTDRDSAAAVMANGGGLVRIVTRILGSPMRAYMARCGDIVLVDTDALGVLLDHRIVAPSKDGVTTCTSLHGRIAWRVG